MKPLHLLLLLLILMILSSGATPHAAAAWSGEITTDTAWMKANSPYTIGDVTVRPGATLTIEPGVEVHFTANSVLSVLGTLHAQGTAEQPILLSGSTATPGAWRGIDFSGTAAGPLAGSILDHGRCCRCPSACAQRQPSLSAAGRRIQARYPLAHRLLSVRLGNCSP